MSSGRKLIVGGEAPLDPWIWLKKPLKQFSSYPVRLPDYRRYYTFGAYFSLRAIIADLQPGSQEYVLLPSYLCPTIIEPFREAGVSYDFYKMKEGLLPDLDDIDLKTRPGLKAILFIDYFGFPYRAYLQQTVDHLRSRGVQVIQDAVQAWLDNEDSIYGDYCFNSLRKYSPFEASVLLARQPMKTTAGGKRTGRFLAHKRFGQIIRHFHIKYGLFNPELFLRQIGKSNELYHCEGIPVAPPLNTRLLDRIDFAALGRKRKIVFKAMTRALECVPLQRLPYLAEAVPLCLAVYLEDRDKKKLELHRRDIHCPLHWLLSEEIDNKEHEYSWDMQNHALSLPVNVKLTNLSEYIQRLVEVIP